ncbi:MAG: J domain-containing protein [Deltaproteobacteria bacterium]|nr:J domain-containing protein [Deltaproteobacteria bacterium]
MTESHSHERPAPSAVGILRDKPLVHLLVYARNKRLTGVIELHTVPGEGVDASGGSLTFWRGRLTDARTWPAVAYFGAVAYELGRIDSGTLDATLLELAKTKRKHGEILLERGAITRDQRDEILLEQTCRKIHHLCGLPPVTQFAFYEATPNPFEPESPIDPIAGVWRALRTHAPVESVREVVTRFASSPLRMVNEGPIGNAGLSPEERALCDALTERPMTVMQMRETRHLPPDRSDVLAYLLVITKCAEPAPPDSVREVPAPPSSNPMVIKTPSGEVVVSSPPPPSAKTPSGEIRHASLSFRVPSAPRIQAARSDSSSRLAAAQVTPALGPAELGASAVAARASAVHGEDYFSALGLPDNAPEEAARAAYFRLARLWHPDRLPPELAPFKAEVTKIFEHLTNAHRVLTDKEERRSWLASRHHKGPVRERKDVLREIDRALQRSDWPTLGSLADELLAIDADDAEALAFSGFASACGGEAPEAQLRAGLAVLDAAIKRDCYTERTFYYRGLLHKRLGSLAGAFRDFTRAAQLDPKHIDAQREIRILEMRARKGSGEHALDALVRAKTTKRPT